VFDDAVEGLTAEHRARIEAALPPGKVMSPEAWAELEEYVVGYRIFNARRTSYPIFEERKRWKRIGDAVDTLDAELRRLRREPLEGDQDPKWPDRALEGLWEVYRRVKNRAAFHAIWGKPFSRRQNPDRAFLYQGVMRVWTNQLGGELRYSTEGSAHYGPLIRFLVACVEPILGKQMPSISTIADIIDREREARAKTEDEKRRWREQWGGGFDC
jgi:hypothetical protein